MPIMPIPKTRQHLQPRRTSAFRKGSRRVGLLLGLALVAAGACAEVTRLNLVTEEYPPYNFSAPDGSATGVSTAIVRELMQGLGIDYRITVMPWARAIALARIEPNTCVFFDVAHAGARSALPLDRPFGHQ
jgi:hypothetical protein